MLNKIILFLVLSLVASAAHAGTPYDQEKAVTCKDTSNGNFYRFQLYGNWMEFKIKGQKNLSLCKTSATDFIQPWKEATRQIVSSPTDKGLALFYGFAPHENYREWPSADPRLSTMRYQYSCLNPVTGESDHLSHTDLAVLVQSPSQKWVTLATSFPFSSAKLAYSSNADGALAVDEKSEGLTCNGLTPENVSWPNYTKVGFSSLFR